VHVRAIRKVTISQSDRASRSIVDHMCIIEALESEIPSGSRVLCASTRSNLRHS